MDIALAHGAPAREAAAPAWQTGFRRISTVLKGPNQLGATLTRTAIMHVTVNQTHRESALSDNMPFYWTAIVTESA